LDGELGGRGGKAHGKCVRGRLREYVSRIDVHLEDASQSF
jgi:hypothetical protein